MAAAHQGRRSSVVGAGFSLLLVWSTQVVVCPHGSSRNPQHASAFEFLKPSYWQQQASLVNLLKPIPRGSRVLEVDCVVGAKTLYYLPFGSSVLQWLNEDEAKKTERGPVDLAAQKLGITVNFVKPLKSDAIAPPLETGAFDAAVSVGAVGRAETPEKAAAVVDAALRALRPGQGVFYLLEPDAGKVEPLLAAALDDSDLVGDCMARVEHDAVVCVVSRSDVLASPGQSAVSTATAATGFQKLNDAGGDKKRKKSRGS